MALPTSGLRRPLGELKRRKVYEVPAVYIVGAVAALELIDLVVPSTSLPPWVDELLLSLAILGLPSAIVVAWASDGPGLHEGTVALLPFEDLSGDVEADPFAAGLHDDVLTEPTRVPDRLSASAPWPRDETLYLRYAPGPPRSLEADPRHSALVARLDRSFGPES